MNTAPQVSPGAADEGNPMDDLAGEIRDALAAWKDHQARMETSVLARSPGDEIADELGELLERALPLVETAQAQP